MIKAIKAEQIKAGNFIVEEYSDTNMTKYELILVARKSSSNSDYLMICTLKNFLHSLPCWRYIHKTTVFGILDLVDLDNGS
jgi:hypothetical protein